MMLKDMTPAERKAAVKRACDKLQTWLSQPHVKTAIEKVLTDFDKANGLPCRERDGSGVLNHV